MSVTAEVETLAAFRLNGELVREGLSPERLGALLGRSARVVDPGPPAPWGHRNNQFHVFDDLGVYAGEHHATRLVNAITFVFDLAEPRWGVAATFRGRLRIGACEASGDFTTEGLAEASGLPFKHFLAGQWSAKQEGGIYVALVPVAGRPRGRRRLRRLAEVSVCW